MNWVEWFLAGLRITAEGVEMHKQFSAPQSHGGPEITEKEAIFGCLMLGATLSDARGDESTGQFLRELAQKNNPNALID